MNRRYLHATAASAALFSGLFAAVQWLPPQPRLLWNASASVPTGLYYVAPGGTPAVGDLVAILPSESVAGFLAARRYLPRGTPLLKRVAALSGAIVCRQGRFVTIDGRVAAVARSRDRVGRPLPRWTGCRTLRGGEIFLLNPAPGSLDSRYFGSLPASGVIGSAHPIITRDAPDASLRWRLPAGDISFSSTGKESKSC